MSAPSWINDLNGHLAQFSHPDPQDTQQMNLDELWGVYRHLNRLSES